MGNEVTKVIEQAQKGGSEGDEGTSVAVVNIKKKIKQAHIKAVAAKLPNVTSVSLIDCHMKTFPPDLRNSVTKWDIKYLNISNNSLKALPKGLDEMVPSKHYFHRLHINSSTFYYFL